MLLGSMLIVSGLVGMYARQAIPAGWLGLIGFILLFFGLLVFGIGFGLISTTVIPWLTTQAPNLIAGQLPPVLYVFLAISIVMIVVGNIPLGAAVVRAGILPRWPGWLLIASGVIGLLDIVPFSSTIKNIIAGISAISFFAGLAWAGYALWSERVVEEVQAPVAPVAPIDTSEAVIEPE